MICCPHLCSQDIFVGTLLHLQRIEEIFYELSGQVKVSKCNDAKYRGILAS